MIKKITYCSFYKLKLCNSITKTAKICASKVCEDSKDVCYHRKKKKKKTVKILLWFSIFSFKTKLKNIPLQKIIFNIFGMHMGKNQNISFIIFW